MMRVLDESKVPIDDSLRYHSLSPSPSTDLKVEEIKQAPQGSLCHKISLVAQRHFCCCCGIGMFVMGVGMWALSAYMTDSL